MLSNQGSLAGEGLVDGIHVLWVHGGQFILLQ